MSLRFAALASVVWVAIAFAFAGVLLLAGERRGAADYVAGYLVEKSLSLDNVFVFLLVFGAFAVAEAERHRLLTYGIVGALVMRAVFIVVGAAALERFSWIAFVFAALLVYTGWRMFRHRHDHDSERRWSRSCARFPIAEGDGGGRLLVRENGRRMLTPAARRSRHRGRRRHLRRRLGAGDPRDHARRVHRLRRQRVRAARPAAAVLPRRGAGRAALLPQDRARGAADRSSAPRWPPASCSARSGRSTQLPGIALILGTGVVASLARQRREDRDAVAA